MRSPCRPDHRDADLRGLGSLGLPAEKIWLRARSGRRRGATAAGAGLIHASGAAARKGDLMSRLLELQRYGQSLWLDSISRKLVTSGELARLVREDGLRGVTSNPAIFGKAITGSADYAAEVCALARRAADAKALYEGFAIRDIQLAADVLRPVYGETAARDGSVSLEVSPRRARDAEATLAEARRLWAALDRPNVMIKVPATAEGIPAVEQLIAEGVNVNVTLLFSLAAYERVAAAYRAGLERRAAQGGDVSRVASVASFFVRPLDSEVDGRL